MYKLIILLILEPPRIIPFSFGSNIVDSGSFAQLTCVVSHGDMPITITWSLKGQKLNSGPSITTTMVGTRTSMLMIPNVDYNHIGEYTCRATNPAGSVTHSTELKVNGKHWVTGKALQISHWQYSHILIIFKTYIYFFLEPPRIVPFSFEEVVDSGAYAQLSCVVSKGDMPMHITWSLKGKELNSGDSIMTTMLGKRASMLIISNVDYTHIGEYTCRATNQAGSVTHSTELKVNGKLWSHMEGTGN